MSVWTLVLVLLAVAFWRTMAPERSARAVRRLVETRAGAVASEAQATSQVAELHRLRQTVARERAALLRLREDFKRINYTTTQTARTAGEPGALAAALADTRAEAKLAADALHMNADASTGPSPEDATANAAARGCAVVLAPVAAEAGLGTQTEHLWAHLSVAMAMRNACVALPAVVARPSVNGSRSHYVPVHEVVDIDRLSKSGLRFVPLRACKAAGMGRVYSDGVNGITAAKEFTKYVAQSDPVLAAECNLVTDTTRAGSFALAPTDAAKQGAHILSGAPLGGLGVNDDRDDGSESAAKNRYCAALGRLATPPSPSAAIVANFVASERVTAFVDARFGDALGDMLFVKLRWTSSKCDSTPPENVCLSSGTSVHRQDYVNAVKAQAKSAGAARIYLSFPAHLPSDIMLYFEEAIAMVNPVVLTLEGDEFSANVVERELAIRSRAFACDGGVWCDTVQTSRKHRNPQQYEENINMEDVMKQWIDLGSQEYPSDYVPPLKLEAWEDWVKETQQNETVPQEERASEPAPPNEPDPQNQAPASEPAHEEVTAIGTGSKPTPLDESEPQEEAPVSESAPDVATEIGSAPGEATMDESTLANAPQVEPAGGN